jgi:hypothetical protein
MTFPILNISTPAMSIPEGATLVSQVTKTLAQDSTFISLQAEAGEYFALLDIQALGSDIQPFNALPGILVSFSQTLNGGLTFPRIVPGTTVNSPTAGQTSSSSLEFTSNGLSAINVSLIKGKYGRNPDTLNPTMSSFFYTAQVSLYLIP